jgi:hypothetical protein
MGKLLIADWRMSDCDAIIGRTWDKQLVTYPPQLAGPPTSRGGRIYIFSCTYGDICRCMYVDMCIHTYTKKTKIYIYICMYTHETRTATQVTRKVARMPSCWAWLPGSGWRASRWLVGLAGWLAGWLVAGVPGQVLAV